MFNSSLWSIKIIFKINLLQTVHPECKFKYANCHYHKEWKLLFVTPFLQKLKKKSLIILVLKERKSINQKQYPMWYPLEVSYQPWCKLYWNKWVLLKTSVSWMRIMGKKKRKKKVKPNHNWKRGATISFRRLLYCKVIKVRQQNLLWSVQMFYTSNRFCSPSGRLCSHQR